MAEIIFLMALIIFGMWLWGIPFPYEFIVKLGIFILILIALGYIIGYGMSLGFRPLF